MKKTHDIRIKEMIPLISPEALKQELPITPESAETVVRGREGIEAILSKKDDRLLVIVGPCSIHDETAALEYAQKLNEARIRYKDKLFIVMRVYFEKPRTTIGWKGLINDPMMDSTNNIEEGLRRARKLLIAINDMGLPVATEMLDPIIPQYIAGLVSWVAIGARTTESQTHREMASGLSMPVGFKNGTDGNLDMVINAMKASGSSQSFLGIDQGGYTSIVNTYGNPWCHVVLRGGSHPNYDPVCVGKTRERLQQENLLEAILVDCSHSNCGKKHQGQSFVWRNVLEQRMEGNDTLIGMMLESNLYEGAQKCNSDFSKLEYGVSVTDECISWETTESLLDYAYEKLSSFAKCA
ncbi:3-deoxy-7-phosphoheptulonate synthase [bacterium]|nr:3-deoxy-7-phosphoheptulonate synthase [bacterium]